MHANLVAPTRSPLVCLLVKYHALFLMLLDSLHPSITLPLRLLLLWNRLLARNTGLGFRECGLQWSEKTTVTIGPTSVFSVGSSNRWLIKNCVLSRVIRRRYASLSALNSYRLTQWESALHPYSPDDCPLPPGFQYHNPDRLAFLECRLPVS